MTAPESTPDYFERQEIWNPVIGYDGYIVSNLGRVENMKHRRILVPTLNRSGYWTVGLYRPGKGKAFGDTLALHRLVALAFLGPCPEGYEVHHKDDDRTNAHIDNLEYVTREENVRHMWESRRAGKRPVIKRNKDVKVKEDGMARLQRMYDLSPEAIIEIRDSWGQSTPLAIRYGKTPMVIQWIRKRARELAQSSGQYDPGEERCGVYSASGLNMGAKLTVEQVREVRTSTEPHKVIARRFGVDRGVIRSIRRGEAYREVS